MSDKLNTHNAWRNSLGPKKPSDKLNTHNAWRNSLGPKKPSREWTKFQIFWCGFIIGEIVMVLIMGAE